MPEVSVMEVSPSQELVPIERENVIRQMTKVEEHFLDLELDFLEANLQVQVLMVSSRCH